MKKLLTALFALSLVLAIPAADAVAEDKTDEDDLRERIEEIEERLQKAERHAAVDRMEFSGDYRFEAHSIQADIPTHFDGTMLQNLVVDALFLPETRAGCSPRRHPARRSASSWTDTSTIPATPTATSGTSSFWDV